MFPSERRAISVLVPILVVVLVALANPVSGRNLERSAPAATHPTASASGSPASLSLSWSELSIPAAASPPPRIDGSMVWDSTDGYGLLFGGEYLNETTYHTVYYNDTWTYLGGHWTNVTSAHAPSERSGTSLTDDPADHEVVLFGGVNSHGRDLNDTWVWSAGTWTNVTPTGASESPPAGFWASMTYDAATSSVLLFGGINESSQYGNDTWSFKAGKWTQLFPTSLPPGRHAQEMVYDAASSEVVMFGGLGSTNYLNDTWTYRSGNWAPILGGNHPGSRVGPGIVYDTDESVVVLYGGQPAPDDYYSTWLFSGGVWAQYNLSANPPNPTNPWGQMIYDPTDHYVFLFYEEGGSGPTMETWALTISSSGPSPIQASLAADPDSISLGQGTTFVTEATGGTGTYRYAYSTLPPGCASANASSLSCTPTREGTFVIGVNVTDTGTGHAASTTTVTVTQSTTTPPPSSNSSSSSGSPISGWEWIVLVAVLLVAALLGVVLYRRRRRPPAVTAVPSPPS